MKVTDGIDVFVVSRGQSLHEYPIEASEDSTAGTDNSHKFERYIEAESGATFMVKVIIDRGFKLYGANALEVVLTIDGKAGVSTRWMHKKDRFSLKDDRTTLDFTFCCDRTAAFRSGSEWFTYSYSFSATAIDEDLKLSKKELREQIDGLGKIVLTMSRVNLQTETTAVQDGHDPSSKVTQRLHKKLAANSVTHTCGLTDRNAAAPRTVKRITNPIGSPYNHVASATFRYRSYRMLQTLGCIPMSLEPAIEVTSSRSSEAPQVVSDEESTHETSEEKKAQLKSLRDQKSQLEAEIAKLDGSSRPRRIKKELKRERGSPSPTQQRKKRSKPEYVVLDD